MVIEMDEEKGLQEEEHHYLISNRRKRQKLPIIIGSLAVAVFLACLGLVLGLGLGLGLRDDTSTSSSSNGEDSGNYKQAAVATDAEQCSKVGVEILKKNGSAVDAAIASLLCVGVINFHSTGIGGGGFMVYYNATSKTATVLDYRETAPRRANSSMYEPFGPNETASLNGRSH